MATEFTMGNMRENSESLGLRKGGSFTREGELFAALVMLLELFLWLGGVANRVTSLAF